MVIADSEDGLPSPKECGQPLKAGMGGAGEEFSPRASRNECSSTFDTHFRLLTFSSIRKYICGVFSHKFGGNLLTAAIGTNTGTYLRC